MCISPEDGCGMFLGNACSDSYETELLLNPADHSRQDLRSLDVPRPPTGVALKYLRSGTTLVSGVRRRRCAQGLPLAPPNAAVNVTRAIIQRLLLHKRTESLLNAFTI
jgi:hypothetical protein